MTERSPKKCSVKGSDTFEGKNLGNIKYHLGAAHLNSSQVVCISFFKKEKIHEQHPKVMNLYREDLVADLMMQAKMAGPDFAAYYEKFEKNILMF